jgi:hypothetical protein
MSYERASAAPLYHFAGVLVTADHPILHAGRWIHAADTPGARPALMVEANAAGPLLYDLVTSGKRIYTVGGGCFSDYDEVSVHFYHFSINSHVFNIVFNNKRVKQNTTI